METVKKPGARVTKAATTPTPGVPIGVLGAMESEVMSLVDAMSVEEAGATAGFQYWAGKLVGRGVVVARCGMGKVSAAMGVQRLIDGWDVSCVVVCGLAGGLASGLRVGDIVVGETFVQHDLDASPIFPRFEVPGLGIERFTAPQALVAAAEEAARAVAVALGERPTHRSEARANALAEGDASISEAADSAMERRAAVYRGLIVTGDQFIKGDQRHIILKDFPDALCVEMEGGAIAQVCHLNEVPFVVVRVVSDTADGEAPADFLRFVNEQAPAYTVGIVRELLPGLP